MKRYNYAVQIQPRNGQQLAECKNLEINPQEWTPADRKQFPQAERSLWSGAKLVVDRATKEVYAVQELNGKNQLKEAEVAEILIASDEEE